MSTVPILNNDTIPFNSREKKAITCTCTNYVLDAFTEEKIILDLISKSNSPHDIQNHIWNVFKVRKKYHAVRKVISRNAKRAKRLNGFFDLLACQTLYLMEVDETFKGRKISLLVVADSLTGYIYMISWLPKRSETEIIRVMSPFKDLFKGVKLVLTDGAPYFPKVIKEICPNARHQRCLIHILRNLYPFLLPQEQNYKTGLKKVNAAKNTHTNHKHEHEIRLKYLDALKHKLIYWKNRRSNMQTTLGVKRYQKGINRQYPELKTIYNRINSIQAEIRSLKNTIIHDKERLTLLKGDVDQAIRLKNIVWNLYMGSLHVLYEFYNLFRLPPFRFETSREKYLTKLVNCPSTDLSRHIIRVLTEVESISSIFTKDCPIHLNRNFINTNGIESINSRLRPLLDKLKKIQNTPYLSDLFELIRLKLNTTPPYSGPRSKTSPIERCGYNLRSRTWIDMIFYGLPPGPQYQFSLVGFNPIETYSDRFYQCKEKPSVETGEK